MRTVVVVGAGMVGAARRVTSVLDGLNVTYRLVEGLSREDIEASEFAIVVGSDKNILDVFHQIEEDDLPILGVGDSDSGGFLTEVGVHGFRDAVKSILEGQYTIEDDVRIGCTVDGKRLPPALNEIATFSSKTATLVEYRLTVNGEDVWRDYGDGVIVSTPVGSTAYSMSAGGPHVMRTAPVLVIVSVNSVDITRRPLVVPDTSKIVLDDLSSAGGCVLVVDGSLRAKARNRIEVSRWPVPAKLIRLPQAAKTMNTIARKVKLAEELLKMPPSAKLVLKTLEHEGPLSQKDLVERTLLPDRTTRLALRVLIDRRLVRSKTLLRDARQKLYSVA